MSKKAKIPLKPTPGHILVETVEKGSGQLLSIQNEAEDRPKMGKVLAIGDTLVTDFNAKIVAPCKVGDTILHNTIGFEETYVDYKKYRIVKFQNVIGIYNY